MPRVKRLTSNLLPVVAALNFITIGCGDAPGLSESGDVLLLVDAETNFSEGFTAGDDMAPTLGMWNVKYTRFLVSIGNFRAARTGNSETFNAPAVYVLDLMNVPEGGYVLQTWFGVTATTWDIVGFDIPITSEDASTIAPATDEDKTLLIDNQAAIYVEGTVSDGMTSKTFKWFLPAGVAYDSCADDKKVAGFSVNANEMNPIRLTIHGDHWFANKYPADPASTKRYAQYVVSGDLDMDGETTRLELEAVMGTDVDNFFPAGPYDLGMTKFTTAFDWVLGQAQTIGNFQGLGECSKRTPLTVEMP